MRRITVFALLALFAVALSVEAQQGPSAPSLPFNTSVFKDRHGVTEGEIVAKIRLSFEAQESEQLCVALGIQPDPRSVLKGYISFLRNTVNEKGKAKQQNLKVKFPGKGVKQDGISFWDTCLAHSTPGLEEDLRIVIRRPQQEPIYIPVEYPKGSLYQWVTITRLPNGGLSWSFQQTEQGDSDAS